MLNELIVVAAIAFIIGCVYACTCMVYGTVRVLSYTIGAVCMCGMAYMGMLMYVYCTADGAPSWARMAGAVLGVVCVLIGMGMLHGMHGAQQDYTKGKAWEDHKRECGTHVDSEYPYTTYHVHGEYDGPYHTRQ